MVVHSIETVASVSVVLTFWLPFVPIEASHILFFSLIPFSFDCFHLFYPCGMGR